MMYIDVTQQSRHLTRRQFYGLTYVSLLLFSFFCSLSVCFLFSLVPPYSLYLRLPASLLTDNYVVLLWRKMSFKHILYSDIKSRPMQISRIMWKLILMTTQKLDIFLECYLKVPVLWGIFKMLLWFHQIWVTVKYKLGKSWYVITPSPPTKTCWVSGLYNTY